MRLKHMLPDGVLLMTWQSTAKPTIEAFFNGGTITLAVIDRTQHFSPKNIHTIFGFGEVLFVHPISTQV